MCVSLATRWQNITLRTSQKKVPTKKKQERVKPPRKLQKWSEEAMKAAVAAVQGGFMSERKAAATYCVPRSTLQQCVSGKRDIKPKLGRKPAFQNDDENKLVDFACNHAQMGVGFGKRQFMKYAADLAKTQFFFIAFHCSICCLFYLCLQTNIYIKKRQIKFRKGTPSEKWWRLFKKRHQHFVQRKPEGTATVQHKLMKKDYVMKYFQELKKEISQHGLPPTQIWNMDEMGIQLEHCPKKIVARHRSRYLHARTSGSHELITVIADCNASGTSIPPHLIVKGKTRLVLHGFDSEKAPVIFKPYNRRKCAVFIFVCFVIFIFTESFCALTILNVSQGYLILMFSES